MHDGVIAGEQSNIEEAMRTYVWRALMASNINAVLQRCFVIIIFPPVSV